MKAVDTLKNEHEAVKLMMEIMDAACSNIKTGKKINNADIDDMIDFLEVFVDKCHHGKEEQILFPRLENAGVMNEGGPIGVLLAEHGQGRGYVRKMSKAMNDYKSGIVDATTPLIENVEAFIKLMEQHIIKENTVLFAMADKLLTAEIQGQLYGEFEVLEDKIIGVGKHEELHKRLERLSAAYLGNNS